MHLLVKGVFDINRTFTEVKTLNTFSTKAKYKLTDPPHRLRFCYLMPCLCSTARPYFTFCSTTLIKNPASLEIRRELSKVLLT